MNSISIIYKDDIKNINNYFIDQFDNLKSSINIDRCYYKMGNSNVLEMNFKDNKNKENNINKIVEHCIANGLVKLIIGQYQSIILKKSINNMSYCFTDIEKEKIYIDSLKILEKNELISSEGITYKISKRAKILKSIINFLDENNTINIEGFINFRLRFLISTIETVVEKVLDDYMIEKEYDEFIRILKYFVDIQLPKVNTVNIFSIKGGKYILYDENMKLIENDFLEEVAEEIKENNMNYDDLLISSLITIAPLRVILHFKDKKESDIEKIIKSIFVDKVDICQGCTLCNHKNIKHKTKEEKQ